MKVLCLLSIVNVASASLPKVDDVLTNVDVQLLQSKLSVETKPVVAMEASAPALERIGRNPSNLAVCQGDCDTNDDCPGASMCIQRDNGSPAEVEGCTIGDSSNRARTDYCNNPTQEATDSHTEFLDLSCYGVWDRSNVVEKATHPFIRGVAENILPWKFVEPTNGTFNWTILDAAINKAAEFGGCFYVKINVGPDAPEWIYGDGPYEVPIVETTDADKWPYFPYYLSENYKKYFGRLIDTLADHIYNHENSLSVGFVMTTFGCTGDAVLYKGKPLNEIYSISPEDEFNFITETWSVYAKAFQSGGGRRVIPLLTNGMADGQEYEDYANEHIQGLGFKGTAIVRGHHLSGERSWIQHFQKYMLNPDADTQLAFTRAEMDQTWKRPLYKINVRVGFYWGVLNGLNQGLAVFDVTESAMNACYEQNFADSLEFFNKYAGQIWPEYATDAFCALHEGLDALDEEKFPVERYGSNTEGNKEKRRRAQNICDDYAQFGCRMDDLRSVTRGQVAQRRDQTGYNDVGYDIWPTNYMRWLEQIDADSTSQGLFRVGGEITSESSKYARFARGLYHSSGKTAMYFKLHDDFFRVTPVGSLKFKVIWYDAHEGSWQFEYLKKGGKVETGWDQPMDGSGTWKEASFEVSDAAMDHTHTRGSDFALVSKDQTDAIFHMVEINRRAR